MDNINNFNTFNDSLNDSFNDADTLQNMDTFIGNDFVINVFNAVIQNISSSPTTRFITISYDECVRCNNREKTVTLIADRDTIIIGQRGNSIPASELQPGMIINASFSAAMTRSIPPQSQAFVIQVINRSSMNNTTVGRIISTDSTNFFITVMTNSNLSSVIRFNVAPNAVILTPFGRSTRFSSLVPGMRVRVTHAAFMTMSIPPQTTAYRIQILR